MTVETELKKPSRADAAAIVFFMVIGGALALLVVVRAVLRMIEVFPNRDVQVLGVFADTPAQAPIGVNGSAAPVLLETAVITAPDLPVAALAAIIIQQVVLIVAVIAFVVCLLLLARNIMRGRVFNRRNTVLVTTAGLTALVGSAAVSFFGNIAANGAFAVISDRTFNNVLMSVDPVPYMLGAFVAALASTAFAVGDRLQRETEGLV